MTEPANGAPTLPPPRCPDCRKTGGAVAGLTQGFGAGVLCLLCCQHCGAILGAQLLPAARPARPLIEVPR